MTWTIFHREGTPVVRWIPHNACSKWSALKSREPPAKRCLSHSIFLRIHLSNRVLSAVFQIPCSNSLSGQTIKTQTSQTELAQVKVVQGSRCWTIQTRRLWSLTRTSTTSWASAASTSMGSNWLTRVRYPSNRHIIPIIMTMSMVRQSMLKDRASLGPTQPSCLQPDLRWVTEPKFTTVRIYTRRHSQERSILRSSNRRYKRQSRSTSMLRIWSSR